MAGKPLIKTHNDNIVDNQRLTYFTGKDYSEAFSVVFLAEKS